MGVARAAAGRLGCGQHKSRHGGKQFGQTRRGRRVATVIWRSCRESWLTATQSLYHGRRWWYRGERGCTLTSLNRTDSNWPVPRSTPVPSGGQRVSFVSHPSSENKAPLFNVNTRMCKMLTHPRCNTVLSIYRVVHKNVALYFCPYICQLWTDFKKSFTGTLCGQFAIRQLYNPQDRKCFSTLPCEI